MHRRSFIATGLGLVSTSALAAVQGRDKMPRIGILSGSQALWTPFQSQLRDLGYVDGQHVVIEWRLSGGRAERFPQLAAELVRLPVDVIVAGDNPAIAAAQRATAKTPIVMVLALDPIASGFIRSLSRPEGNITGLSANNPGLRAKALQLLKDAVPNMARVAVLWDPTEPGRRESAMGTAEDARTLKLQVTMTEVRAPTDLPAAFATMARQKVDAVVVGAGQMITAQRETITALAVKHRLPTVSAARWYAEAGGVMSYGLSYDAQFRRAAHYVDRILRGTRPADLPVEQPTRFELVLNLKTAKTLGLKIPPTLLSRADRVIE